MSKRDHAKKTESNINRSWSIALSVAILAIVYSSCAPPNKNRIPASQIKYAHTPGWESNTMLALSPGSTLLICDHGTGASRDIIRAVQEWAAAAGMGDHLKVAEGCGGIYEVNSEIGSCGVAAVTSHWGVPGQWKLTYCSQGYTNSYDITLHEVGHMYGQCDRYGSGGFGHPVRGQNCSDQGRGSDGNYTLPSAMQAGGPAHPHRVTEDDRNGVKALMERNDIRGATKWRTVAGTPGTGSNTLPPGSTTNNPSSISAGSGTSTPGTGTPGTGANIPSGGTSASPNTSSCSQFFNQIFQKCDANGICNFLQSTICGG